MLIAHAVAEQTCRDGQATGYRSQVGTLLTSGQGPDHQPQTPACHPLQVGASAPALPQPLTDQTTTKTGELKTNTNVVPHTFKPEIVPAVSTCAVQR